MSIQGWRKSAFLFTIVGAILFIILISIATLFYPGYSIFVNSWSDLGTVVGSRISRILYSIAMVLWGSSYVPGIQALPSLFPGSKRGKLLTKIGLFFAVISVLSFFVDVFIFPIDLHPIPHLVFAILGYLTLLMVQLLFAIVMFSDASYPKINAVCFFAVAVVIIIYLIFNAAILQKTVSVTLVVATVIVFSSAWKATYEPVN